MHGVVCSEGEAEEGEPHTLQLLLCLPLHACHRGYLLFALLPPIQPGRKQATGDSTITMVTWLLPSSVPFPSNVPS